MRGDQVVDEIPYLVQVQLGSRVRIHHRGVVHMLTLFVEDRGDRQLLHIDVCTHQRGQLGWQGANPDRLDAVSVHMQGTSTAHPFGSEGIRP